jgi:multidrug efflux pump subunit AcrA (membrane-fusion protein)
MFATAEVAIGEVTLPSVPVSAVKSDKEAGTDRVFIVTNRVIEERLVQLGPTSDGFVSIRSGLSAGERVVLAPSPGLADGQRLH